MSVRVTQSQLYGRYINNMNTNLSSLIELNLQSSSQLKVNRPSDDPAAAGLIISSKATIERLSIYTGNLNAAKGWLSVTDSILASEGSLVSITTSIKNLALQASTGTYTKENREQIGGEIRQLFYQLINLSNSTYGDKHVFSGQKTDKSAYTVSLGLTSNDKAIWANGSNPAVPTSVSGSFHADYAVAIASVTGSPPTEFEYIYSYVDSAGNTISSEPARAVVKNGQANIALPGGTLTLEDTTSLAFGDTFSIVEPKVTGSAEKTIVFQAESTGAASAQTYRYSADGGDTWIENVVPTTNAAGNSVITTVEGVEITLNANVTVTAVNKDDINETDNGTWLYARPSAQYHGDDNDTQVVMGYGNTPGINADAKGFFSSDVSVKIVEVAGSEVKYAYSTDDGVSWTHAKSTSTGTDVRLSIPGGFVHVSGASLGSMQAGEQFTVHPHRADINIPISDTDTVTVNLVGKDVFGGQYVDPKTGQLYAVEGDDNLFEVVGELIGYCETGSQSGIQRSLEALQRVMEKITTQAAVIGGRWTRVEVTMAQVEARKYDEQDYLSSLQDVDVSELMIKLSQQQIAYNSVLKSSSMIMQMSLVNYL